MHPILRRLPSLTPRPVTVSRVISLRTTGRGTPPPQLSSPRATKAHMPCTGLSTVRGGVLPVQYRRLRRSETRAGSAGPLNRLGRHVEWGGK